MDFIRSRGFKTFGEPERVDFSGQLMACIVGLNGSGKSCIVDAIAFACGARKSALRVSHLRELITVRPGHKYDKATVELGIQVQKGQRQETEVFKREVSDAGSSTFSLFRDGNWVNVSRPAYQTALASIGIDMELQERFIVRQSNTVSIAKSSSKKLLEFCEKLVGTILLKAQIEEHCDAVEALRVQSANAQTKLEELQHELHQVSPMVAKLVEWNEKQEGEESRYQIFCVRFHFVLNGLIELEKKNSDNIMPKLDILSNELNEANNSLAEAEKIHNTATKSRQRAAKTLRDIEKKQSKLLALREAVDIEKQSASSQLKANEKQAAKFEKRLSELISTKTKTDTEVKELNGVIKGQEIEAENLNLKISAISPNEIQSGEEKFSLIETQMSELKLNNTRIEKAKEILIRNDLRIKSLNAEETALRTDLESCTSELSQKQALFLKQSDVFRTLEAEGVKLQESLKEKERRMCKIDCELAVMKEKLSLRGFEHGHNSAIKQIHAAFPNAKEVPGYMWEVIKPSSLKYKVAFEAVLNSSLSMLVVEKRDAAIQISKIFSKLRAGRLSCCIYSELDKFRCTEGCKATKNYVPLCSIVRPCNDNEFVDGIIHKYCRNWIVVPSMDQVLPVKGKSYVTMDGELFLADGEIRSTNYSKVKQRQRPKYTTIVGQGIDLDKENRRHTVSKMSFTERKRQISQLEEEIRSLQPVFNALRDDCSKSDNQLRVLRRDLHCLDVEIELLQKQKTEIKNRKENVKGLLEAATSSSAKIDNEDLPEMLRQQELLQESISVNRKALGENSLLKVNRSKMLQEIKELQEKLTKLLKKQDVQSKKHETLKEKIASLMHAREQLVAEESVKTAKIKSMNKDLKTLVADTETAKEIISQKALDYQNASLAQKDAALAVRKLNEEFHRMKEKLKRITAAIQKYEMEKEKHFANATAMEGEMNAVSDETDCISTLEKAKEQYKKLVVEGEEILSSLEVQSKVKGSISESAVSKAIELRKEIDSLMIQQDFIKAKRAETLDTISQLQDKRLQSLTTSLDTINGHLLETYKQLCEHGDCYLGFSRDRTTLYTEGISFHCKPDEDQWQEFRTISGGQQVLCALSLTIAFQQTYPCPFYICDEMDAALDTVNVEKLAEFLSRQSIGNGSQFIIVSHRNGMWERMPVLIGVYESEGVSKCYTW